MEWRNNTNDTLTDCQMAEIAQIEKFYLLLPIMLVCCFVAMLVNVVVIASARWIRCPMTPNLKISLSLAAADATSSTMYASAILFDDYDLHVGAFIYVVEILRLSGIGEYICAPCSLITERFSTTGVQSSLCALTG